MSLIAAGILPGEPRYGYYRERGQIGYQRVQILTEATATARYKYDTKQCLIQFTNGKTMWVSRKLIRQKPQ